MLQMFLLVSVILSGEATDLGSLPPPLAWYRNEDIGHAWGSTTNGYTMSVSGSGLQLVTVTGHGSGRTVTALQGTSETVLNFGAITPTNSFAVK